MKRKAAADLEDTDIVNLGNCQVKLKGSFHFEQKNDILQIDIPRKGTIIVEACKELDDRLLSYLSNENLQQPSSDVNNNQQSYVLFNPKAADAEGQLLLQEVLKLYQRELPAMRYVADTRKESSFMQTCISSGKYCTLVLLRRIMMENVVLGAITFQVLPDSQYAEIPLAAVSDNYKRHGLGRALYQELRKRLQSVGVLTIFCWGDKESERFWQKQGFLTVAEVDSRGKHRKLPINAEVRRAMCIPCSSNLMVSHLHDSHRPDLNAFKDEANQSIAVIPLQSRSPILGTTTPKLIESKLSLARTPLTTLAAPKLVQNSGLAPLNIEGLLSSVAHAKEKSTGSISNKTPSCIRLDSIVPTSDETDRGLKYTQGHDSSPVIGLVQESSLTEPVAECNKENCIPSRGTQTPALKGKRRARSSRSVQNQKKNAQDRICVAERPLLDNTKLLQSTEPFGRKSPNKVAETICNVGDSAEPIKQPKHVIMFMNMANESQRMQLTKFVEGLGGEVTSEGSRCTHVITGEVRRTLNLLAALCAGSWILSPTWLKASVKEGHFVDEDAFVLDDKNFQLKYKTDLKAVLGRAKARQHRLLNGMSMYVTPNVQPDRDTIMEIIRLAGGKVMASLKDAIELREPSPTIVVACEQDLPEALCAAKEGLQTYTSEWLMSSILKQELDLMAPQFTESL